MDNTVCMIQIGTLKVFLNEPFYEIFYTICMRNIKNCQKINDFFSFP